MNKTQLKEYIENNSYKYHSQFNSGRAVNIKLHSNHVSNTDKAYSIICNEEPSSYFYDNCARFFEDTNEQLKSINSKLQVYQVGRSGGHLFIPDISIFDESKQDYVDLFDTENASKEHLLKAYKTIKLLNELKKYMFEELEYFIKSYEVITEKRTFTKDVITLKEVEA